MKYGIWNIAAYDPEAQRTLCAAGYSPLTAAVLCSRGYETPAAAREYLSAETPLHDPMLLRDMAAAAERVKLALSRGEQIAVFGDYDVDGITATCLLTDFLRRAGGNVTPYIPARMEEGYGLNETAIRALHAQGIQLIVSVDCGITADEEALLCRELGIDLIITDHHECKDTLPCAVAVVNPHRRDDAYPYPHLAGVGVAFKLASAVSGDQAAMLHRYCDLVCLGTVADVMTLQDENRAIVSLGLRKLTITPRVGILALMSECACSHQPVTASLIGYTLAPRINAAGRMGRVEVAQELFLTEDPIRAADLASQLCRMNRQRQAVELEIYRDALARLSDHPANPAAIVLAGENWHQGVVGIVASRLSEEFSCPTFLICMDGDRGKASSRSYGGFNLFQTLETLAPLLESYGGHELAAGFTILRSRIDEFREHVSRLSAAFRESGSCRPALEIDCEIPPEMLTIRAVDGLDELEPCGAGCPRPTFAMKGVLVEQLTAVGGGKHLRMRLSRDGRIFLAIFFSTTAMGASVAEGDLVEVAFQAQINEFRGQKSVQLNLVDIRPDVSFRQQLAQERALYRRLTDELPIPAEETAELLPERREFVALWKYLSANAQDGVVEDAFDCLARKTARAAGLPCSLLRTKICLDVFEELELLRVVQRPHTLEITLDAAGRKVDLASSRILLRIRERQAGET